jgi:hypothetical protein
LPWQAVREDARWTVEQRLEEASNNISPLRREIENVMHGHR